MQRNVQYVNVYSVPIASELVWNRAPIHVPTDVKSPRCKDQVESFERTWTIFLFAADMSRTDVERSKNLVVLITMSGKNVFSTVISKNAPVPFAKIKRP